VLLPMHNPKIQVVDDGAVVKVAYEGVPRYVFPVEGLRHPAGDQHDGGDAGRDAGRAARSEAARGRSQGLTAIEMEVEENIGQAAVYRVSLA
jgi:hypothetical protein